VGVFVCKHITHLAFFWHDFFALLLLSNKLWQPTTTTTNSGWRCVCVRWPTHSQTHFYTCILWHSRKNCK